MKHGIFSVVSLVVHLRLQLKYDKAKPIDHTVTHTATLFQYKTNVCLCVKNMAFQADQKVKGEIVRCLGTEQLFRLLSDPDTNVLMKTLGLLRNLLSTRQVRHTHTQSIINVQYMKHLHGCFLY